MKQRNPVWDVYDLYRTSLLNAKYHARILKKLERRNFIMEYTLLITAPSSAVAALWFWETPAGELVWKTLAGFVAFIAIAKPLLNLTTKIKNKEKLASFYQILYFELKKLVINISQEKKYNQIMKNEFERILGNLQDMVKNSPPEVVNKKIRKECQEEVNRELPASNFFVP